MLATSILEFGMSIIPGGIPGSGPPRFRAENDLNMLILLRVYDETPITSSYYNYTKIPRNTPMIIIGQL